MLENTNDHVKPKRIGWVDYAKFIGIGLVVFGHLETHPYSSNVIYSFHMPLFFFLSGLMFSFKKHPNYKEFFISRFKQLIVPYLFFNLITYVLWLWFVKNIDDLAVDPPYYKPFLGIFYGNSSDTYLIHCLASWFLICLFVVENIYYLVYRNLKGNLKYLVLAGFVLLGRLDLSYIDVRLPWSIDVATVAIVFYISAGLLKPLIFKIVNLKRLHLWLISAAAFCVVLLIAPFDLVDMSESKYQNFALFFIGGFSGILFTISLSRLLELKIGSLRIVTFIATNTIVIIVFNFIAIYMIKYCYLKIFDFNPVHLHGHIPNFLITLCVFVILVPVMNFTNTYIPFSIGRSVRRPSDKIK